MTNIRILCPKCHSHYTVDKSHIGGTARCKKCNTRFVVADTEQVDQSKTTGKGGSEHQVSASTSEADEPAEWKVGDVILDQYEVKGVLGEGGMGRVYDVWHRGWNKRLAVKSPRPDYFKTERQKESFTREAETWMELGLHPHAVSCFYVRTLGGIPRVFAERIEGGDLKQWIDSKKLYEGGCDEALKRMLDIAIQFAWGLQYAHDKGLIHQDVKPANVLLTAEGVVKVTDFGLAKARGEAEEDDSARDGRSILASYGGMTPAYCSPEQANKETLSRRTDIWSWAVSILEMFVGDVTWRSGVATPGVLESYLGNGANVDGIPPMPEALSDLLKHCLAYEQESRPRDFDEVCRHLLAIYLGFVGEGYARMRPNATKLQADMWNNRGVSHWDLGKTAEAEAAFEKALTLNAQHSQATFNVGLLRWRNGRGGHAQLLRQLSEICDSCSDEWQVPYLIGLIHLEQLDVEKAIESLELARGLGDGVEVRLALEEARRISPKTPRCIRVLNGHSHRVSTVSFSPDGRFCLSGGWDYTCRLWDATNGLHLKTFKGRNHIVNAAVFSPNGETCLIGSDPFFPDDTHTLQLWNTVTNQCVQLRSGRTHGVTSVAFSPDGRFCVSTQDAFLELCDILTGERIFSNRHDAPVKCVAFSPDGRFLLSGGGHHNNSMLQFLEASKGSCLRTLHGHSGPINSVCFGPNNRFCLSGSSDGTLRRWDLSEGQCSRVFYGHKGVVYSVALSPDGRFCLSGSSDTTLRLWDASTGVCLRTFEGHVASVNSVAFSPDGRSLLSGSEDRTIRLWEASMFHETRPRVRAVPSKPVNSDEGSQTNSDYSRLLIQARRAFERGRHAAALTCLRQARDLPGKELEEEAIALKHLIGRGCTRAALARAWMKHTLEGHSGWVTTVAFSPDSRLCLSGSFDKTLRLWDISTKRCVRVFEGHDDPVNSVAFSPDGRFCLSGSHFRNHTPDYPLRLWDVRTGECVQTLEWQNRHETRRQEETTVAFGPDGRFCLSGGPGGYGLDSVRLWNASSGECELSFGKHPHFVNAVAFSPDGRFFLSASRNNAPQLWGVHQNACLQVFEGHAGCVNTVAFSPDARFCLTGGYDKTCRLWDTSNGQLVKVFQGHSGSVNSVAFSVDGRICVSGSADATLRLWNTLTGECVRMLDRHDAPVNSVAFSPNGRFCISGSEDKTLRLWELDWDYEPPTLGRWLRARISRFLGSR